MLAGAGLEFYTRAMDANTIIDRIGGTSKVATLCGRTKSAVSQWRRNGIPEGWEHFLRATCPDAFAASASADSSEHHEAA